MLFLEVCLSAQKELSLTAPIGFGILLFLASQHFSYHLFIPAFLFSQFVTFEVVVSAGLLFWQKTEPKLVNETSNL